MQLRPLPLLPLLLLLSWTTPALAQGGANTDSSEIERLITDGAVEALEARFAGPRTPDQARALALAAGNKAARTRDDSLRDRVFDEAERRFQEWIGLIENASYAERVEGDVRAAAARVAYAGMLLGKRIAPRLDEYELTAGERGDPQAMLRQLEQARRLYDDAHRTIEPLAESLRAGDRRAEELYLSLGIYEDIRKLELDIAFDAGWTQLYIGMLDQQNPDRRADALREAERSFRWLVTRGQSGDMGARIQTGLAMTLREQQRYDEANQHFDLALSHAQSKAIEAQVRYEKARNELRAARYEDARLTLRPLINLNPNRLPPEWQPARFYVSLAHIWDANSYLVESDALRAQASGSTAREAIERKAERIREIGLARMHRLAAYGGPWPALVGLYVSAGVDPDADMRTLAPAELLFVARDLMEQQQYRYALARLNEAAGRPGLPEGLAAEILLEIGVCHYRSQEEREAAQAFQRFVRQYAQHEKAPEAATYAYQLWATIAQETEEPEDFQALAETVRTLLETFPSHEKRDEAAWLLPVALQAAGQYEEAARQFDNVPADSPRSSEAQFRAALCRRQLLSCRRAELSPRVYQARALEVADALKRYGRETLAEAEDRALGAEVRQRAKAALLSAAEMYCEPGVQRYQAALDLLDGVAGQLAEGDPMGRVLAVRMTAYRGLGQYEAAAEVVATFLRSMPEGEADGTLASIAEGIHDEVQRLSRAGDEQAARELARQSVPIFERLEQWVQDDPRRNSYVGAVTFALAQMYQLAGQHDAAEERIRRLLQSDPDNGHYQRLHALVKTESLPEDASDEQLAAAREAWAALLRDPGLRTYAPDRYWEARWHVLSLLLRAGEAVQVEKAIRQDRVWYPELGGERWQAKLDALYAEAQATLGADTQPAGGETP